MLQTLQGFLRNVPHQKNLEDPGIRGCGHLRNETCHPKFQTEKVGTVPRKLHCHKHPSF